MKMNKLFNLFLPGFSPMAFYSELKCFGRVNAV